MIDYLSYFPEKAPIFARNVKSVVSVYGVRITCIFQGNITQPEVMITGRGVVPHATGVGLGYVIFQHLVHVRCQCLGMETLLCLCHWRRLPMQGLKIYKSLMWPHSSLQILIPNRPYHRHHPSAQISHILTSDCLSL